MSKLKNIFMNFDIYGTKYSFEENGSTTFSSLTSLILSAITFTATFVIAVIIGTEIHEKKKPIVNSSLRVVNIEDSRIDLSSLPMFFFFGSSDRGPGDYYDIVVENYFHSYTINSRNLENSTQVDVLIDNVLGKCDVKAFPEKYKAYLGSYVEVVDGLPFCVNYTGLELADIAFAPFSQFIELRVDLCDPQVNPNCKNIFDEIDNLEIFFAYPDDFNDVEKYNNATSYVKKEGYYQLTKQTYAKTQYEITKNRLLTDVGNILEDWETSYYVSITEISKSLGIKNSLDQREIISIFFQSSTLIHNTSRNYMKLQTLIANIGGIYSFISFIAGIIARHHNVFKQKLEIYKILKDASSQYLIDLKNKKEAIDSNINNKNWINSIGINKNSLQTEVINLRDNDDSSKLKALNLEVGILKSYAKNENINKNDLENLVKELKIETENLTASKINGNELFKELSKLKEINKLVEGDYFYESNYYLYILKRLFGRKNLNSKIYSIAEKTLSFSKFIKRSSMLFYNEHLNDVEYFPLK